MNFETTMSTENWLIELQIRECLLEQIYATLQFYFRNKKRSPNPFTFKIIKEYIWRRETKTPFENSEIEIEIFGHEHLFISNRIRAIFEYLNRKIFGFSLDIRETKFNDNERFENGHVLSFYATHYSSGLIIPIRLLFEKPMVTQVFYDINCLTLEIDDHVKKVFGFPEVVIPDCADRYAQQEIPNVGRTLREKSAVLLVKRWPVRNPTDRNILLTCIETEQGFKEHLSTGDRFTNHFNWISVYQKEMLGEDTSVVAEDDDETCCSICYEKDNDGVVFDCNHSMCIECFKQFDGYKCHLCRKLITVVPI